MVRDSMEIVVFNAAFPVLASGADMTARRDVARADLRAARPVNHLADLRLSEDIDLLALA